MQLIVGCDASAHILWGSTDINPQGECLTEYLVSKKYNTLNPLPLLFKTLLHGQKDCVFSAGI